MPENIVIKFDTNPEALLPVISLLEKIGQVDKATADQFRKDTQAYQERAIATSQLSDSTDDAKKSIDDLNKSSKDLQKNIATGTANDHFKKLGDEAEKATTKTQRLTTQIREIRNQLSVLESQGKRNTKQFLDLSIAAGKLQDQIGDTSKRVQILASDTKNLDAALSLASGVAGGFAVAQGAAALFGKENEEIQKVLLKVQAALAVLNGLQAVAATLNKDSAASVVLLRNAQLAYNVVVGTSTGIMKAFRIALASTGVGLLIVGVAALIENFDKVKAKLIELFPFLNNLGDIFTKIKGVFFGVVNAFTEGVVGIGSALKNLFQGNFKDAVDDVRKINLAGAFKEGFDNATKAVEEGAAKVEQAAQDHVDRLGAIMKKQIQQMKDAEAGLLEAIRVVSTEQILPLAAKPIQLLADQSVEIIKESTQKITDITKQGFEFQLQDLRNYLNASANLVNSLFLFKRSLDEREIAALQDKYTRGLISEQEYQKQLAQIKRKQAVAEKDQQIFNTIINTAAAIADANPVVPLMVLAAAAGAAQLAAIVAQPIPQFAEGTELVKGGIPGRDSVGALLMPGERVVPTDINSKLNGIPNSKLPELMKLAPLLDGIPLPSSVIPAGYDVETGINYDLLADKVGAKFKDAVKDMTIEKTVWDAEGVRKSIQKGNNITEYQNKRHRK